MGRRKGTINKEEKKSPIKIRPVIRKQAGKITEPYTILEALLAEEDAFMDIRYCRIKLFWQKDSKVDPDGIATGATVCKASELDRNLVEEYSRETPDVFIRIAEKAWGQYTEQRREQVIFHELCHVHQAKDANGEQKRDAKDRNLWRIGRHPIVGFPEEVAKYGIEAVLGSNQATLDAIQKAAEPLLAQAAKDAAA